MYPITNTANAIKIILPPLKIEKAAPSLLSFVNIKKLGIKAISPLTKFTTNIFDIKSIIKKIKLNKHIFFFMPI